MARTILVDELIDQVRQLIDEENQEDISDTRDILPSLNRAMDVATSILAKHYNAPLRKHKLIQLVSGTEEYDIPEDAFEERVELIEVLIGNYFYPLKQLDPADATHYEATNTQTVPYVYVISGRRIRVLPGGNSSYKLRVWYDEDPLKLVKQQGRIEVVDTVNNSVVLDSIGSDLTTESDSLKSYVNIIDGQSGIRKATLQVKNIVGNEVFFKAVPTRSLVRNVDIDTSIATDDLIRNSEDAIKDGAQLTINPDDYMCLADGTCIPTFKKPLYNYLISYSVAELRGVLDGSDTYTAAELDKMEKLVERSWSNRPNTARVRKNVTIWNKSSNARRNRGTY